MSQIYYTRKPQPRVRSRRSNTSLLPRLLIAAAIALFSIVSYYVATDENPITGESQRVALDTGEEIQLGMQAAPEMVRQHKGLYQSRTAQQRVDQIGAELLRALERELAEQGRDNPYPFEFHVLADQNSLNAFALPGGQIFITAALYERLITDGMLAGVIGHEMGHVLSRHGAQRMAKQQLTVGLSGAAGVAGGDESSAQMAQAIGQLVNLRYGREDELESDKWGVKLTAAAGYDPRSMIDVMKVLDEAAQGPGQPEFLSTHPKPANRVEYIKHVIDEVFPDGVPTDLRR